MKCDFLATTSNQYKINQSASPAETLTANLYNPVSVKSGIASSQLGSVIAAELIASLLYSLCACLPACLSWMSMWLSHKIAYLPSLLPLCLSISLPLSHTHSHWEQAKVCQCNPGNAPCKLEHPGNKIWGEKKAAGEGMFAMQIIKEVTLLLFTTLHYIFLSVGLSVWMHVIGVVSSHSVISKYLFPVCKYIFLSVCHVSYCSRISSFPHACTC